MRKIWKAPSREPVVLDRAMFVAAVEAAGERAARAEYIRQVSEFFAREGYDYTFHVQAPDRLVVITDFLAPRLDDIDGRPVVWR